MCKSMEEFYQEAVEDARIEIAESMLEDNKYSLDEVAKISKLSLEDIKIIKENLSSQIINV